MFAMLVLDERLSAIEWVGAAVVLLGLALAGGGGYVGGRGAVSFARRNPAARRGLPPDIPGDNFEAVCWTGTSRPTPKPARTCSTSAAQSAGTLPCSSTTRSSSDRDLLSDPIAADDRVTVFQALSGGAT